MNKIRNGIGIMAIVGNQGRAAIRKHIEAARCGLGIVHEGRNTGLDRSPFKSQGPCSGQGCHGIVDLETNGAAAYQRYAVHVDTVLERTFNHYNGVVSEITNPPTERK